MTYQLSTDWRNKRNTNFGSMPPNYNPMHYSISSYCTETKTSNMGSKSDLNEFFNAETYLSQLHNLSNPLQKNLADTLPKPDEIKPNLRKSESLVFPTQEKQNTHLTQQQTTFASIGNFISGVFNVITSAMPFQKRPRPSESFHDDFIFEAHDASPPLDFWRPAKFEQQNKNNCSDQSGQSGENNSQLNMSVDCQAAAAHCEDKLTRVKNLLTNNSVTQKTVKPVRLRRPKKVFVQPDAVEECYGVPFDPEELVRCSDNDFVECVVPVKNLDSDLVHIEAPVMRVKMAPLATDVKPVQTEDKAVECDKTIEDIKMDKPEIVVDNSDLKSQVIQKCEDKCSQLKALLLERRKNNTKTRNYASDSSITEEKPEERLSNKPISISNCHNKKYKNPNRLNIDKRSKCRVRKNIEDDMKFAHEVDIDLSSSAENTPQLAFKNHKIEKMPKSKNCVHPNAESSPKPSKIIPVNGNSSRVGKARKLALRIPSTESSTENLSSNECGFNEISGRFHNSSTTDSEDSFQIVFADSPQNSPRTRKTSDCDSEDSFIIFEDESPDSCYTSTDVFGNHETEESEECSDYDSDYSDSGHETCKLAHTFSRTISDLTDDSLYEDNAVLTPSRPYSDSEDEVDSAVRIAESIPEEDLEELEKEEQDSGLLMNDTKRMKKKKLPPKKVRFTEEKPSVHVMHVWSFAARQARRGHWDQYALDRGRFKRRIADVDMAISWVLKPQHRSRITFQRFMPWWHAQRRQELAEKKARKEEEKTRAEEKRVADEEEAKRLEEETKRLEEEAKRLEEEARSVEDEGRVEDVSVRDKDSDGDHVDVECTSSGDGEVTETVKDDKESVKGGDDEKLIETEIKDGKDEDLDKHSKEEMEAKVEPPVVAKPSFVVKRHYDSKGNLIEDGQTSSAKNEKSPKPVPKPSPIKNNKKPPVLVIKSNAVKKLVSANNKVNKTPVVKKSEPPKTGRYWEIENTVVSGKGYYGIDNNMVKPINIVPSSIVAESKM